MVQISYAGLISSFLAGVHWGQSLPRNNVFQMLWSMVPSIVFLGLFLFVYITNMVPHTLILAALVILGQYFLDKEYLRKRRFPDDYMQFRLIITSIVFITLILSAFAFWF